jgi:RNA polymerase sigma-70 factor (ECF subfamily)
MGDAGYPQRPAEPERRPVEEPSDRDLVALSKRGDRTAFGRLLRRHQRRVFALGLRWLRNADDADDLVQETFVRVWQSISRFDEARPFAPWLVTIAVNRAKTKLARRRPTDEVDESLVWEGPSPLEDAETALLARNVRNAVDGLPEDQRIILHLRAVEGLSYAEIASALEIPTGTVMSRLARAREALRGKLARASPAEDRDDAGM